MTGKEEMKNAQQQQTSPQEKFKQILRKLFNQLAAREMDAGAARKKLHSWWNDLAAWEQAALAKDNAITQLSGHMKAGLEELHNEVPALLGNVKEMPSEESH